MSSRPAVPPPIGRLVDVGGYRLHLCCQGEGGPTVVMEAAIGETGLLIYRTEPPLVSTRGQRADHLAIGCRDLAAALAALRARGVTATSPPQQGDDARAAMIEGPDRIAIELVEIP